MNGDEFRMLDLPRRRDIDELNRNLQRVAEAVELLERAYERREPPPQEDERPNSV